MPKSPSTADPNISQAVSQLLPMFRNPELVEAIWKRFCVPLHRVAARYLGEHVRVRIDPEDVVQSVYRTLYRRALSVASAASGPTPPTGPVSPDDPDALWKLLATVTMRKAINKRMSQLRLKRSVAMTVTDAGLDWAGATAEPTPAELGEQEQAVANLKRALSGGFKHDLHKKIAALVLDGRSAAEVAAEVGCVERTVYRVKRELEEAAFGVLAGLETEDAT